MAKDTDSNPGVAGRDTYDGGKRPRGLQTQASGAHQERPRRVQNDISIGSASRNLSAYSGYTRRVRSGDTAARPLADEPGGADIPMDSGVRYTPDFAASMMAKQTAALSVGAAPTREVAVAPGARKLAADIAAEKLADVLEREDLLYRDAAAISGKKTDVIVHGKIEELESLVKAEQAIILKIGRLEDEREAVIAELSDALGLELEDATLADINALVGEESFARLDGCQKALAGTLGGLKNTNDMNAQLIQNALDYINFSVNLITTDQSAGNVYSSEGEEGAVPPRRNIFDVKL